MINNIYKNDYPEASASGGGITFDGTIAVGQAAIRSGAATLGALTGNNTSVAYWANAGANLATNIFFVYGGAGDATGAFLGVGVSVPTEKLSINGNFYLTAAGNKFIIKEGVNASMGVATLVAGAATVATNIVTLKSRIFLTAQNDGAAPGALRVSSVTPGVSFNISSTSGGDTSDVAWHIIESD